MLLSRVANSLYWMGRYLERAENANRHLLVACEFSTEFQGISPELAQQEWNSLRESLPSANVEEPAEGVNPTVHYFEKFMIDASNPVSVTSSLARSRENARSVGENLSFEVTYNLNESYRRLTSIKKSQVKDAGRANELITRTHNSILTTLGAMEHTLTRGQGWNYLKLGEAMERTQRTLFVLKNRLPVVLSHSEEGESPLFFAAWRSLLRSLASLENYRQENGPRFDTEQVTKFLLFNESAPRSVSCGVKRMEGYLNALPESGPGIKLSRKKMGRLASRLDFDSDEILHAQDLTSFLDEALFSLFEVHEAISNPMRVV